jgi:hypothetical protein
MAQYTGILSIDILEASMPSKAQLREASLGNDSASARLFMRQVDAFIVYIECALGIDPSTKRKLTRRGLFGDVEAYFGMVETQGRGTLHIHLLIWLKGCPTNSASIDRILESSQSDMFKNSVESYVNSILSTAFPIGLDGVKCPTCGASFSDFSELPIPSAARNRPRGGHGASTAVEPHMLRCSVCACEFSSQHVLRSALLQCRPLHWPAWSKSLSADEIIMQTTLERKCRGTMQQAVSVVDEREQLLASLSTAHYLRNEDGLSSTDTKEWLDLANVPQMEMCKSDNDPFQNEYLTRLIEMLPPSKSDTRIPVKALDYMVAALVLSQISTCGHTQVAALSSHAQRWMQDCAVICFLVSVQQKLILPSLELNWRGKLPMNL